MKCTSIVIGGLLSLPVFATAGPADDLAAAQRAQLVTTVQAQLGVIPADGKMGPRTHAAIEEFQRVKGLEASGQLDRETIVALGLTGPKPSAAAGASADATSGVQGKPSTPIGPSQSSAERAAEPIIKPATPTGEPK